MQGSFSPKCCRASGHLTIRPFAGVTCSLQLVQGLSCSLANLCFLFKVVSFQDLSNKIGDLFRLLDQNGNGFLTYVEMQVLFRFFCF